MEKLGTGHLGGGGRRRGREDMLCIGGTGDRQGACPSWALIYTYHVVAAW